MIVDNYYDTRYVEDKGRPKVWKAICNYLQKYIDKDSDTVLDLGSGYCDFINNILAKQKYAVDLNPNGHKHCNKDVTFYCSSVTSMLDIKDKSVNIVFASNLLEHLDRNEIICFFREIKRILKSNGKVIIIQPNYRFAYKEYFDDYTHISVYSHISLSDIFKANDFELVFMNKRFLPLTVKSILPKNYFLTKLYIKSPIKPLAKQMLLLFKVKD